MFTESPTTAYLNEPFSHALRALAPGPVVFEFEPGDEPPAYRRAMTYVRAGVPAFADWTVIRGGPWRLRERLGRRMVIKDVNPLAAAWLARKLRPVVVLLVRHPAACAASQFERGWVFDAFLEQFSPGRQAELATVPIPAGFWGANAALQGLGPQAQALRYSLR